MWRLLLLFAVGTVCYGVLAQAPNIQWQQNLGGSDIDIGRNVIIDPQDRLLISSITASTDINVPAHPHARGHWLKSMSISGELDWTEVIGYVTPGNVRYLGLEELSGQDGFWAAVTVDPSGDLGCAAEGIFHIWLGKLDPDGAVTEEFCLGGSEGDGFAKILNISENEYLVLGTTYSNDGDVSGNHGLSDILLLRINENGQVLQSKCFGGSHFEGARNIISMSDGSLLVSGSTRSDDHMLAGINTYPTSYNSAWLMKLDTEWNIIWQHCYGGENYDEIMVMGEYSNGDIWTAGFTRSTTGEASCNSYDAVVYWVLRLDAQGLVLEHACFGGTTGSSLHDAMLISDDRLLLIGHTASSGGDVSMHFGATDVWLVQLDHELSLMWERSYGGSGHDQAYSSTLTPDGGLVFVGQSASSDGDLTGNHGMSDVWVVKLEPWINVGVQEEQPAPEINIYPNPANDLLFVDLSPGSKVPGTLRIYNALGSVVMEEVVQTGLSTLTLPIAGLTRGAYMLRLEQGATVVGHRFIKH